MLRHIKLTQRVLFSKQQIVACLIVGLAGCDQSEDMSVYCLYEGQRLSVPQITCQQVGGMVLTKAPILQEPKPVAAPRGDVVVRFMSVKKLTLPENQDKK